MDDYIAYMPEDEGFQEKEPWEVWSRLPSHIYDFKKAQSRGGGAAMRAMGERYYIWVDPQATAALLANPRTSLMVLGHRHEDSLEFHVVSAVKLSNSVAHARAMNVSLAKVHGYKPIKGKKKP